MKTFKNFLTESRFDFAWERYGDKITPRLEKEGVKKDHKEFFRSVLEKGDPTPTKKYTPWIAKLYGEEGIKKHEDIPSRIHAALSDFDKNKHKLHTIGLEKDINKYKSIGEIESAADKIQELAPKSEKEVSREEHDKMASQAEHHEDENWKIKVPLTKEASCHYGKGTKWCTAANQSNMFSNYNKKGKLHIFIPKSPKHEGEKYQLHLETGSLNDERDNEPDKNPFHDRPSTYFNKLLETNIK